MRDAHLCGRGSTITGRPSDGLATVSPFRQGCLCRHRSRVRVAQHQTAQRADWVEQGIAALSARCSRTSPIKGIRLRLVLVRGWWPRTCPGW